jgi:hypothetical protein
MDKFHVYTTRQSWVNAFKGKTGGGWFALKVFCWNVFMLLAFACQSIFASIANEYVDEILQYVHVFINENDLREVNIEGQYSIGDFGTRQRTGDISLDKKPSTSPKRSMMPYPCRVSF